MQTETKKQLGAFYTPEEVTNVLSNWAICNIKDIVLEPSFGGCNFLTSSIQSLKDKGAKAAYKNVYGYDIDPSAFEFLRTKRIPTKNFILGDFLFSPLLPNKANVVLGNPPYLPVHKLTQEYKDALRIKFKKGQIKIKLRSSLWIYFIVHSLNFLADGGRMAWVVPDSISFTNYGHFFLEQLKKYFKKILLFRIDERYFHDSGTHEKTSILLCDGYLKGECEIEIYNYKGLKTALEAIKKLGIENSRNPRHANKTVIKIVTDSRFRKTSLSEISTVKIGIVIGATKLLTFTKEQVGKSPYFPNYVYPIITKGKQLKDLEIDTPTLLNSTDGQIYLLDVLKLEKKNKKLFNEFLKEFPEEILLNQTFSKRETLFGYDDFRYPDGFITYYSQELPKIIINWNNQLNCTNSVHRLYLNENVLEPSSIMKLLSMQTYIDLFEKETKDLAREYGNSILKFEPSDILNLPVVIPMKFETSLISQINRVYEFASNNIKNGNSDKAKIAIEEFFAKIIL